MAFSFSDKDDKKVTGARTRQSAMCTITMSACCGGFKAFSESFGRIGNIADLALITEESIQEVCRTNDIRRHAPGRPHCVLCVPERLWRPPIIQRQRRSQRGSDT